MKKLTDQELNKNLLINMCRVQTIKNDGKIGKRIFDVLLSDVFHMLGVIFGINSKKYFEEIIYISKDRDMSIPVLNGQSREIREYLWNIILEKGKDL